MSQSSNPSYISYKSISPDKSNLRGDDFVVFDANDIQLRGGRVVHMPGRKKEIDSLRPGMPFVQVDRRDVRILTVLRPEPQAIPRPTDEGLYLVRFHTIGAQFYTLVGDTWSFIDLSTAFREEADDILLDEAKSYRWIAPLDADKS